MSVSSVFLCNFDDNLSIAPSIEKSMRDILEKLVAKRNTKTDRLIDRPVIKLQESPD